jgi:uncharacterized membrane protein
VWGLALTVILLVGAPSKASAEDGDGVVQATLFYSPYCEHCHQVIEEVLPPLQEQHGSRLEIELADVTTAAGSELYQSTMLAFGVPPENWVVPILVCGDVMLVGGLDIPEQFPALIEQALSGGGGQAAQTDVFGRDMPANAIALAVLCGMVVSVALVVHDGARILRPPAGRERRRRRPTPDRSERSPQWAIPALCLYGLVVSVYLGFVEIAQAEAVCWPVGDCNAVQQSEYAFLLGVVPVGVVGILGYGAMLIVWLLGRPGSGSAAQAAPLLLLGLAGPGTLLSIYLTFLEPFVIGATCLWCLTSSVAVTAILLLAARPGWKALRRELGARRARSSGSGR